jgi:acetate kinase
MRDMSDRETKDVWASEVAVRVIHTDEEWVIAKTGCRVFGSYN